MKNLRVIKVMVKALFFVTCVLFLWRASIVRISKNFYEVDPGRFYRSAQLSPGELEAAIKKYGIKTVISLRGAPENSYWTKGQLEVLNKYSVKFVSLWWTTDFLPSRKELIEYLEALKSDPYPILVHCRTGADRTGEATALYAMDFMGMPMQEALDRYLSFRFWHVRAFHPAKAEFVRRYKGHDWAIKEYDPCHPDFIQWAEPGQCPLKPAM